MPRNDDQSTSKGAGMKIVCIAASFVPANTANSIQVLKATHGLAELGHDMTLLIPGAEESTWNEIGVHYGLQTPFDIVWIRENLSFKRYDFAAKAIIAAKELKPDLIYTWLLQAGVLALVCGLPTILELHDRVTGKLGPFLFRKFWAAKTPHRILTNTDALRKALIADFSLRPLKNEILVAPNGVELVRYQDQPSPVKARQQLGLPERFTAGYTGHFYEGRGMNLMFDLARALPEIQFLWVGGHPEDVALWQNRLRSQEIDNIILTGFVSNAVLPKYQAAADVLMMPYGTTIAGSGGGDSADIASPMKMFEYMAAGRAILSSDLPVFHEVLNEETAVFCPPDDVEVWRESLLALQANPTRRHTLGDAARLAVKNFTWRARADKALNNFAVR